MNPGPKFVFFGTPRFAKAVFQTFIDNLLIPSLLVCNPDRPTGRKQILTPPPTKIAAEKYGVEVFQPENLSDAFEKLNRGYDFFAVAAYGKIIPKDILELPKYGSIGIHPSLLPKYRGTTPIQSVILNGDDTTGVTLFLMDEKIDHGEIISRTEVAISKTDTYLSLEEKLAKTGAELFVKTIPEYIDGKMSLTEQMHGSATFTKKITGDEAFVRYDDLEAAIYGDTEKTARVHKIIRALNPEPGAWTLKNGKRMKLLEGKITDGKLVLVKIQMEGKMPENV
ncbi:methionyl-tRNA formyltransferase [Candidatus Jorgensenbacteria bacterium RIFCSPLOWO2_02_FULL_45_12]|uniref:Methionyl-tRNA formyltransferase n=2 Tax=Candidatus Joergenseniibacteriota TaxID=1752739 RepID=A0A1F6BP47_9BACT|nr:MAG: Methionyl-tRNA formyltransferase [Candidatus Jorgensenbacteria bacterium GW2011_GWA2_45_9]OGG38691.1 MAG: methionyl-tRNA formyltransferase [Candidatus Jorgensenbacteria bacterium RIFCSPHIGHO2_02_FULL_45_20]OGG42338.1 MAG: methionyl-tRNA formyltransferase [Candidatus Jorgensenbacteria bacterium RIFCSPLOWO2_02_FULL_45_12]